MLFESSQVLGEVEEARDKHLDLLRAHIGELSYQLILVLFYQSLPSPLSTPLFLLFSTWRKRATYSRRKRWLVMAGSGMAAGSHNLTFTAPLSTAVNINFKIVACSLNPTYKCKNEENGRGDRREVR